MAAGLFSRRSALAGLLACVGLALAQPALAGGSPHDADHFAQSACQGLQEHLGAAAFASKFGSLDGCVAKVSSLVSACKAQAPSGGDAFKACVTAQLRPQLRPSSGDKGASKSVPDASQLARSACQGLQGQLGAAGF